MHQQALPAVTRFLIGVATLLCGYLALGALRASPAATQPASATASVLPAENLSTCVVAVAAQSAPAKLATLGRRQANPRRKRILYYLAEARAAGADPAAVADQAQQRNGSAGTPRAPLVKASLLRNLKICDGLGMITPENLAKLRRGNAPTVMRGPYAGQIGNELANLELLPAALNRAKSDKVGERQLALAKQFCAAGLLSPAELAEVQARFRPAGTEGYQLPPQ